jgi:hypothetical protein
MRYDDFHERRGVGSRATPTEIANQKRRETKSVHRGTESVYKTPGRSISTALNILGYLVITVGVIASLITLVEESERLGGDPLSALPLLFESAVAGAVLLGLGAIVTLLRELAEAPRV